MASCRHKTLELLPQRRQTLRCRHCHLTIAAEELGDGFCPECFANSGSRRYEFQEIGGAEPSITRYRCDECGGIIVSRN